MKSPRARIITRWKPESPRRSRPLNGWQMFFTLLTGTIIALVIYGCQHR